MAMEPEKVEQPERAEASAAALMVVVPETLQELWA